jgi:hypothetical protein
MPVLIAKPHRAPATAMISVISGRALKLDEMPHVLEDKLRFIELSHVEVILEIYTVPNRLVVNENAL